ncbi:OmpH family outer membrane protein [Roseospira marina]|uniref:OmpH family outer membrane protein n=1 Tax=Roseospira marina TaxID=140057 RepID=A0A5M6I9T0_9PROT|nr:OmpH family outer membrane protein [Roseospira marina]KAA5604479.1 OmpH family outer membrane protein [Roseospira marina]MBB4315527.1 Skp family chaperone for outer membrane proteins [Roseospira marina]
MMFPSFFRTRPFPAILALVIAVAAVTTLPASDARAQDPFPNAAIGIIDMQRILQDSSAARGVEKERQSYLEAYNRETAAEEQALREEQRSLSIGPNEAPSPELQEKAQAFRGKVATFERRVAERRRNLERALSIALSQVQQTITVVADEVAAERGINLVLYRSQVPLFDPRMEMTDDVLARLNERLPKVSFPDPAALPTQGDGGQ